MRFEKNNPASFFIKVLSKLVWHFSIPKSLCFCKCKNTESRKLPGSKSRVFRKQFRKLFSDSIISALFHEGGGVLGLFFGLLPLGGGVPQI